ncbi:AraC family transcriptional regulator [Saccharobesus litoralis]|uniref:AraC family transcriptional regulator n=1 Tax=Saccharobesus litoralis TaxID=2172099 RepID=A0A2S0VU00_9ALTE|nr:AraC family transcriptional regulator [Saccharobesus litoralis]AWB67652.1 AraC family transcriptional regulator [Saccharobesus litoralis]
MQASQVYCEPFVIEHGYQFEIHHVKYKTDDAYSCFMHFHEVHEFIIFDEIEGSYYYSQGESQLKQNDIVFTPALETHDFELSNKQKSWYIIQFLPSVIDTPEMEAIGSFFQQGMHLRLPEEQMANIKQQVKWLYESYQENPMSEKSLTLLKLLVIWIAEYAKPVTPPNIQPITKSLGFEKLTPVINMFRQQTSVELTLVEAAELCHLSPSYFSRMFKKVFRCNFSEYSLRHKLYSAARMLSQSHYSITDISYELHFSSPSHFISQFKKQFATTPHKYRADLKERAINERL